MNAFRPTTFPVKLVEGRIVFAVLVAPAGPKHAVPLTRPAAHGPPFEKFLVAKFGCARIVAKLRLSVWNLASVAPSVMLKGKPVCQKNEPDNCQPATA